MKNETTGKRVARIAGMMERAHWITDLPAGAKTRWDNLSPEVLRVSQEDLKALAASALTQAAAKPARAPGKLAKGKAAPVYRWASRDTGGVLWRQHMLSKDKPTKVNGVYFAYKAKFLSGPVPGLDMEPGECVRIVKAAIGYERLKPAPAPQNPAAGAGDCGGGDYFLGLEDG